ncbi:hypothetical protein GF325_11360 [Candidatus Bathyarchaeota archaeon]|nr:hypothetical protein [Candidatus Bathyarchaeota archaeon]
MSNKIIFVGPASAGKTTLRKIFFEYQSAEQLLQYALDPTYGIESIVLDFGKKIGVFDLAGQENKKWLESSENEIFQDATHVLIIIDSSDEPDANITFVRQVLNVRKRQCPDAIIYLFMHKIDLLTEKKLKKHEKRFREVFSGLPRFKVVFTSIKRQYFLRTLMIFRTLIKNILTEEVSPENLNLVFIKDVVSFMKLFKEKDMIYLSSAKNELRLSDARFKDIMEMLRLKGYITTNEKENDLEVHISLPDKEIFLESISDYSETKLRELEEKYLNFQVKVKRDAPPILGCIVADKIGRTLIATEAGDDIFNDYLGITYQGELDLIAPFVSALEHFSKEIKIIDMGDFKLHGTFISLYVIGFDNFLVIFFLNPNTNEDGLKKDLHQFISTLINENREIFEKALNLGSVNILMPMDEKIKDWLVATNEIYESKANSFEIYDLQEAKEIFTRIGKLESRIEDQEEDLEMLDSMKTRLVRAIFHQDLDTIKLINKECTEMERKQG